MSHSFKKTPFMSIAKAGAKEHKRAKRKMTRQKRRRINQEDELPSGSHFKKWLYDWRWRPDDGRRYRLNIDQKILRK
jgi:hypothetical protein